MVNIILYDKFYRNVYMDTYIFRKNINIIYLCWILPQINI